LVSATASLWLTCETMLSSRILGLSNDRLWQQEIRLGGTGKHKQHDESGDNKAAEDDPSMKILEPATSRRARSQNTSTFRKKIDPVRSESDIERAVLDNDAAGVDQDNEDITVPLNNLGINYVGLLRNSRAQRNPCPVDGLESCASSIATTGGGSRYDQLSAYLHLDQVKHSFYGTPEREESPTPSEPHSPTTDAEVLPVVDAQHNQAAVGGGGWNQYMQHRQFPARLAAVLETSERNDESSFEQRSPRAALENLGVPTSRRLFVSAHGATTATTDINAQDGQKGDVSEQGPPPQASLSNELGIPTSERLFGTDAEANGAPATTEVAAERVGGGPEQGSPRALSDELGIPTLQRLFGSDSISNGPEAVGRQRARSNSSSADLGIPTSRRLFGSESTASVPDSRGGRGLEQVEERGAQDLGVPTSQRLFGSAPGSDEAPAVADTASPRTVGLVVEESSFAAPDYCSSGLSSPERVRTPQTERSRASRGIAESPANVPVTDFVQGREETTPASEPPSSSPFRGDRNVAGQEQSRELWRCTSPQRLGDEAPQQGSEVDSGSEASSGADGAERAAAVLKGRAFLRLRAGGRTARGQKGRGAGWDYTQMKSPDSPVRKEESTPERTVRRGKRLMFPASAPVSVASSPNRGAPAGALPAAVSSPQLGAASTAWTVRAKRGLRADATQMGREFSPAVTTRTLRQVLFIVVTILLLQAAQIVFNSRRSSTTVTQSAEFLGPTARADRQHQQLSRRVGSELAGGSFVEANSVPEELAPLDEEGALEVRVRVRPDRPRRAGTLTRAAVGPWRALRAALLRARAVLKGVAAAVAGPLRSYWAALLDSAKAANNFE
jgi:hypothetical protein